MTEVTRTVLLDGGTRALHLRGCRLTVSAGNGEAIAHHFAQRVIRIGTHAENDVVLGSDALASRRHCRIEADERGYRLVDEGSKNGTWIGGVRVGEVWLPGETSIRVGGTHLLFQWTEEEVEVHLSGRDRFGGLLGSSLPMREVFGLLEKASPTDLTVLVEGESGTGKELVAEALHEHSQRTEGPFVVFDCSAVSGDLIESELFGHVKGAFTGAISDRPGAFEAAEGGTLFLDEVGELSPEMQPKLLRALERRQVRRVGANAWVPVNVRIVAATNRNLRAMVQEGLFREDLYYRLAVLHVRMPALRDRPEDIPLLAEHFLQRALPPTGGLTPSISFATMERLKAHRWPGNVRELRNFIERAAVLSEGAEVETRFLRHTHPGAAPGPAAGELPAMGLDLPFKDAKHTWVDTFERTYWEHQLDAANGNLSEAARRAGVHRKSAEYIVRKLGVTRRGDADEATG